MADETAAAGSASAMSDIVGMFNFFIEPPAAARCLRRKWFWVAPLVLVSLVALVTGLYNMPIVRQVMLNQPPPPNVDAAQYQRGLQIGLMVQQVAIWFTPLITAAIIAVSALLIFAAGTVVGLKARFAELFNFMAGFSLFYALQVIVATIIIHAKGEIQSMAELQPALGLDIFMPEGTNKVLVAFLGFFNVFELWQIVMMVLVLSAAYRIGKGKAAAAISPLIVLTLLLKLAGALFTPSSS